MGPRSAGAEPGPACYGRGGDEATVTDASVVLGYLNPDALRRRPDDARRRRRPSARSPPSAGRLGLDAVAAAAGIHRVINARMADQIRLVTIKRGYDPRQFALVVLGGAGPVHGAALAEEMGMAEVLVPEAPGVLAAFGLLAAAIEHHHARTLQARTDAVDLDAVNRCLAELDARRARAHGARKACRRRDVRVAYAADMRYVGQAYELEVPIARAASRAGGMPDDRARRSTPCTSASTATRAPQQPVEFVNFRAVHRYPLPRPARDAGGARRRATLADARVGERRAYFAPAASSPTAIYERARLPLGARVAGPGHRRAERHDHRRSRPAYAAARGRRRQSAPAESA